MLDVLVIVVLGFLMVRSNRKVAAHYPGHEQRIETMLNRLFFYHAVFSFLFPLVPGDAIGYWNFGLQQIAVRSDNMSAYFGIGTIFLLFLDFIPVKILGLSFLTGNFLYGILGFMGMRYLFRLLIDKLPENVKILDLPVIPFLFYLPNLNFWTGGIGKDTLCFFGIAWFLFSLEAYWRRVISLVISFALVYYVRPHVAMMMVGGVVVGVLVSRNVKPLFRFLLPIAAIGVFLAIEKQVAAFLKVDSLGVKSLAFLASDRAAALGGRVSGSSIDITNYSVPARLLTYLFRPLFFDVHNLITFLSSVENLVYIIIAIAGFRALRWRDFKSMPFWMVVGGTIFIISVVVFANSLGNLGIVMRMKNMTMIYFLCIMIWAMSERQRERRLSGTAPDSG